MNCNEYTDNKCRWYNDKCIDQYHRSENEPCESSLDCCCGNYCGNSTTKNNVCLQKCDPYNQAGNCLDTHECASNIACKSTSSCIGATETTLGKCRPLMCKAIGQECINDGQCCTGQCDYFDGTPMRYRPRFGLESMFAPSNLTIEGCGAIQKKSLSEWAPGFAKMSDNDCSNNNCGACSRQDNCLLPYCEWDNITSNCKSKNWGEVGADKCEKIRICREPTSNPNHLAGPSVFESKQHVVDETDLNIKMINGGPLRFMLFEEDGNGKHLSCYDAKNTVFIALCSVKATTK